MRCPSAAVVPRVLIDAGLGEPLYDEVAAVIVALVLLGRYLEARARARTGERSNDLCRSFRRAGMRRAGGDRGDESKRVRQAELQRSEPSATSSALQATVLDLDPAEDDRLRTRLEACPGVTHTLVDAGSAYVYVEFRSPCTEDEIMSILRATGRPVLTEPGCC